MKTVNCQRCGAEIKKRGARKYCLRCRKLVDKEIAEKYIEKHLKSNKKPQV